MIPINKQFVIDNLLSASGNLNPRALSRYNITKEQAFLAMHELLTLPECKTCGNPTKLISFSKGFSMFCSNQCVGKNLEIQEKKQKTLLCNYTGFNSDVINERKKQTSLKNYGVEYARQSKRYLTDLKLKWEQVHGVTNFSHTPPVIEKRNQTNLKKYGHTNPMQSTSVREKVAKTNMDTYGVKTVFLLEKNRRKALANRRDCEVFDLLNDREWLVANKNISSTVLAESLGVAWSTILNYFEKHGIKRDKFTVSKVEHKIHNLLDSLNIQYQTNERNILDGKEIDIFIPMLNIGIEIDGIYWHSDRFIKDPYYHQRKTVLARQKSVQLLHITDYEILNKFDIVVERLYNKLGISDKKVYARKCEIQEVNDSDYKDFINQHHIQGYCPAKFRYALTIDNQIQAIMSFSKPRYNKNYEWELVRYSSAKTVIGGASRLFKHFIKCVAPNSIISYADLRWNTGSMYEKIGMNFSDTTKPNYWYVTEKGLLHRSLFQKHKLKNKLTIYDPAKTEWENMSDNGYYKFWDCGSNVYTWKKSNYEN